MADFGETAIGASEQFLSGGYVFGTKFTLGSALTLTSVTVRVKTYGGTPHSFRAAIYADSAGSPSNVLAQSSADGTINAANTWFTVAIDSFAASAATVYWIAVLLQTSGEGFAYRTPGDVTNQSAIVDSQVYPTFPDPWTETFEDQVYSIYATGTAGATTAQEMAAIYQALSGTIIGRVDA